MKAVSAVVCRIELIRAGEQRIPRINDVVRVGIRNPVSKGPEVGVAPRNWSMFDFNAVGDKLRHQVRVLLLHLCQWDTELGIRMFAHDDETPTAFNSRRLHQPFGTLPRQTFSVSLPVQVLNRGMLAAAAGCAIRSAQNFQFAGRDCERSGAEMNPQNK
jgi:hypothetical protein